MPPRCPAADTQVAGGAILAAERSMNQSTPSAVACEVLTFPDMTYHVVRSAHCDEATIIGTYPPGYAEPIAHINHRTQETWVVLAGALEITVDGTPVTVSAGQRLEPIAAGVKHQVANRGDVPAVAYVVAWPGAATVEWLREISAVMTGGGTLEQMKEINDRHFVEVCA